jgi:hypothetical protein
VRSERQAKEFSDTCRALEDRLAGLAADLESSNRARDLAVEEAEAARAEFQLKLAQEERRQLMVNLERIRLSALEPVSACQSLAGTPIHYAYQDGDAVQCGSFEVLPTSRQDVRSLFLICMPKAGSVLVNQIARDLLPEQRIPCLELPAHLFERGISVQSVLCNLADAFPERGYCFAEMRGVPAALLGSNALRRAKKLLIVRDPRDMLVSLYFSIKRSHAFPEAATPQFTAIMGLMRRDAEMLDIDRFCLLYSCVFNGELINFRSVMDDYTIVLRYEDFVYDKAKIVRTMRDMCGFEISEQRVAEIVRRCEVFPDGEDPGGHIRQVHPGDCYRKLKPATIASLNSVFTVFMETFGYHASVWPDRGSAGEVR